MPELYGPPGRPWGVFAETIEGGGPQVLRWFPTQREALDHPVKLALWKRVWIEKRLPPEKAKRTGALPWVVDEPAGNAFTYIRDADGARLMSLFGSKADRQQTIEILRERGLM